MAYCSIAHNSIRNRFTTTDHAEKVKFWNLKIKNLLKKCHNSANNISTRGYYSRRHRRLTRDIRQ